MALLFEKPPTLAPVTLMMSKLSKSGQFSLTLGLSSVAVKESPSILACWSLGMRAVEGSTDRQPAMQTKATARRRLEIFFISFPNVNDESPQGAAFCWPAECGQHAA
jgi:hypothetical protein